MALFSAIIISAVLMEMALSSGKNFFSARMDSMNEELHVTSKNLADSCAQIALLRITENYLYTPPVSGENVPVGERTCTIVSVIYDAENVIEHKKSAVVITRGHVNNSWVILQTTATIHNPSFPRGQTIPNMSVETKKEI